MYYNSKDFIKDLRRYREYEEKIKGQDELLSNLRYLRYSKVKSPLDYDIVGYQKGELVRSIKRGTAPTVDEKWDLIERLDQEIQRVTELRKKCELAIKKVDDQLLLFDEPIRKLLVSIYVDHTSIRKAAQKASVPKSSLHYLLRRELNKLDPQYKGEMRL